MNILEQSEQRLVLTSSREWLLIPTLISVSFFIFGFVFLHYDNLNVFGAGNISELMERYHYWSGILCFVFSFLMLIPIESIKYELDRDNDTMTITRRYLYRKREIILSISDLNELPVNYIFLFNKIKIMVNIDMLSRLKLDPHWQKEIYKIIESYTKYL